MIWFYDIPDYALLGGAYCLFILFIFGYIVVGLTLLGQGTEREIKTENRSGR